MHLYYRWQVTTLPQERYCSVLAIAGFICLALAVTWFRDLLARGRALSPTGAVLVGAGAGDMDRREHPGARGLFDACPFGVCGYRR